MIRKFFPALSAALILAFAGIAGAVQAQPGTSTPAQQPPQQEVSILEPIEEAPESAPPAAQDDNQPQLTRAEQDSMVREVYELARKADTAKQLTQLIEVCQQRLKQKLGEENVEYLKSTVAWALHKRGDKRMTLADDLRRAGNASQATTILETALMDFNQALANDPDLWRALLSRGVANVQRGEFGLAVDDFSAVITARPQSISAWFNRAEVYYAIEKHALAAADYSQVLKLDAQDYQALTGRGHANFRLGKTELAEQDYTRVVQLQPASPMALINRGDLYQARNDWQQAINDFEAAMRVDRSGMACQRSAWLLATCPDATLTNPGQSLDLITKAISMGGQSVVNLETLAAAYAALGQYEQAKIAQKKAIERSAGANEAMQARMAMYEEDQPFRQQSGTLIR